MSRSHVARAVSGAGLPSALNCRAFCRGVVLFLAISLPFAGVAAAQGVTRGVTQGNQESFAPAISRDGRFIAFTSCADNLVSGDTNGTCDVFLHDRQTATKTRVSIDSTGTEANAMSGTPSVSGDGRFVAFESLATNLNELDTNSAWDIFVHDRLTSATTRVSVGSTGTQANGDSFGPVISADGRYVAFYSEATTLVSDDTNGVADVFIHDRQTGATTRSSVSLDGTDSNGPSRYPSVSEDGRFVTFTSDATNLVGSDTNAAADVFVRDQVTGTTTRVSVDSEGNQGDDGSYSWSSAISADGRYAVFESAATNLVPDDANGSTDVFVHDRQAGSTTRLSEWSSAAAISADGRFVAYLSFYYSESYPWYVCVYDREALTTTCVSADPDADYEWGGEPNDGVYSVALSGDGRYAAFDSSASNYVLGDSNGTTDVFLYDAAGFKKRSPFDGHGAVDAPVTVEWSWAVGTTEYEYCYDTIDNESCDATWIPVTGTHDVIAGIQPGTTYFWQVRSAITFADDGRWWSFTTMSAPGTFGKVGPPNGATNQPVRISLNWASSSDAESYESCIDTIDNDACDGTWWRVQGTSRPLDLSAATTYYWQVRATNGFGTSYPDEGSWWSFTTAAAPAPFSKITPANRSSLQFVPLTLSWRPSAGATNYEYCYDTIDDGVCQDGWLSTGLGTSVTLNGLFGATTYYWVVRANGPGGTVYADTQWWSFTTAAMPAGRFFHVFWQHTSGILSRWAMQGLVKIDGPPIWPSAVNDLNWRIVGSGDFDGDGQADLLWQNRAAGLITVWLMNGSTFIAPGILTPHTISNPHWAVRAVADMDRDGKPDIIWQHETEGWLSVWLMDGLTLKEGRALVPNRVNDTGWRIAGAADLNGDGQQDLVWQHARSGMITGWLMQGTSFDRPASFSVNTVSDPAWLIRGVLDVDGNGSPDFIFEHEMNGQLAVWLLQGTTYLVGRPLTPNAVSPGWRLAAVH